MLKVCIYHRISYLGLLKSILPFENISLPALLNFQYSYAFLVNVQPIKRIDKASSATKCFDWQMPCLFCMYEKL
jgi:hypothetical protein